MPEVLGDVDPCFPIPYISNGSGAYVKSFRHRTAHTPDQVTVHIRMDRREAVL